MNGYVEIDDNMKNSANDKVLKKIFRKLLKTSLRLAKILQRPLKSSLCIPVLAGFWVYLYSRWVRKGFFYEFGDSMSRDSL